jgi:hypothetical protein
MLDQNLSTEVLYKHLKSINGTKTLHHNMLLNVYGAVVQMAHETNFFRNYVGNNLAGIKCTESWTSGKIPHSNKTCTKAPTKEWDDVKKKFVSLSLGFRMYNTVDHFLYDYSYLLQASRYKTARLNHDCVYGFFAGLLKGGWATDPWYYKKLCVVAAMLGPKLLGAKWHNVLVNSFSAARERNMLEQYMIKDTAESLKIPIPA